MSRKDRSKKSQRNRSMEPSEGQPKRRRKEQKIKYKHNNVWLEDETEFDEYSAENQEEETKYSSEE